MGRVESWRSLPKEGGDDTWGSDTWREASLQEQGAVAQQGVWQGGLRSSRLCSKWLCFQVSEPWDHLSQKMFLEAGTAERGKIRKS